LILKGTLLGTWLFMFGTIAFLYFAIFRRLPHLAGMIDPAVFRHYTTKNPLWWSALAASIVLGCALVGSWPGKGSPVFWVVLLVTDLIPLGLLALFLILVAKLKEATPIKPIQIESTQNHNKACITPDKETLEKKISELFSTEEIERLKKEADMRGVTICMLVGNSLTCPICGEWFRRDVQHECQSRAER